MSDKLRQEAKEAAEAYWVDSITNGDNAVLAGCYASSYQDGYIAAATAREKEIASLRKQVDGWKWIHNDNLEGLMILHDRQDLTQAAGIRIGDNISQAVPYLVAEIDRLRAKPESVPVEPVPVESIRAALRALTFAWMPDNLKHADTIDRWLAGLRK